MRYATIAAIEHRELGALQRIDTDGLDYIFYPVAGDEVVVNAEEAPGSPYDKSLDIGDWTVVVHLEAISEPVAD